RGALPIVTVAAPDGQGAPLPLGALDAHPGPVLLCARDGIGAVRGARPVLALRAEGLSRAARRAMWSAALPDLAPDAALLAARYPIEPHVAAEVALDVRDTAQLEGRAPALADVVEAVRTRTAAALSTGASLVRPAVSWDDLVLPPDRLSQLREAIGRLLHQPRVIEEWGFLGARPGAHGVRALFVGPPGTGKTLSAEVMAGALGTDLLVVDISRVVSKWIGETEKNLAAVFDVAERARAVLFFDEADALFGKRTEVSDAHDRYANLETAYLLARLERFEGLVILASNFRQNIDAAFLRRLEFVIEFEEPDLAERERLWSRHVPPGAPLAPDVHLGELSALYPITGGLIRNAAAAAGFLAAGEGTAITRRHFIHAIRREYDKAGRAFPGAPPGMTNHQGGTMS
ncbi:MAG TPA: ATP-binding protein, partial [Sorangium sp.]|nr:ATP-binding protein [Sorangium sp.]